MSAVIETRNFKQVENIPPLNEELANGETEEHETPTKTLEERIVSRFNHYDPKYIERFIALYKPC